MRFATNAVMFTLLLTTQVEAQVPTPEAAALAARAGLRQAAVSACAGEFKSGETGAFAVALAASLDSGRYVILGPDASVTELAKFAGDADLSCYSRTEAEALHAAIRESETIAGEIAPRFDTTVVCGFVRDTESICWQYSPTERAFIRVGGWIT